MVEQGWETGGFFSPSPGGHFHHVRGAFLTLAVTARIQGLFSLSPLLSFSLRIRRLRRLLNTLLAPGALLKLWLTDAIPING